MCKTIRFDRHKHAYDDDDVWSRYGVYVANYEGPNAFFELDAAGRPINVAAAIGLNLTAAGRGIVSGAFLEHAAPDGGVGMVRFIPSLSLLYHH
jgi:hypothetical protein